MAKLLVNSRIYDVEFEPHETLAAVLRNRLGLIGTKTSCDMGECGACTVLMQGKPILACLTLAAKAEGKEILTVEGLADSGKLHPVQEAFAENFGMQCGFCTPGMILTAKALLDENPNPTEREVREAIVGNICRCGTYTGIVRSVLSAAKKMRR